MGVTQGAGLSLQWFRNQLAPGASYDDLTCGSGAAPAGSQGLYWLPYLMGERTPHLDAMARGGWIGVTAKHTRADLIRVADRRRDLTARKIAWTLSRDWACRYRIGARFGRRREERVLAADAGRYFR